MYVDMSASEICQYPCSTEFCLTETHHYIDCPTWTCYGKSTPTPEPLITTSSPPPGHSNVALISSVTVNVLIILGGLLAYSVFRWRKRNRTQNMLTDSIENPLFDHGFENFLNQNQNPIIRSSSERLPLLALRSNPAESQSTLPENQVGSQPSGRTAFPTVGLNLNRQAAQLVFNETTF